MLIKNLILLAGVLCGSLSVIFSRIAIVPAMVLVVYRMFAASLFLTPQMVKKRHAYAAIPRSTLLFAALGGVSLGLHFAMYFEGVRTTSIAAASVLCNTQVIFVAVFSAILFRVRYSAKVYGAMALALGGACLLSIASSDASGGSLSGNLFAIGSAITLAFYTMISARCRRDMDTTLYTTITYPCAFATAFLISLISGLNVFACTWVDLAAGLGLAVFCTFLGHSLFSYSLKFLSTTHVSTIQLLDSVFCLMWGILFFREVPTFRVLLGSVISVLGVVLFCLWNRENQKQKD